MREGCEGGGNVEGRGGRGGGRWDILEGGGRGVYFPGEEQGTGGGAGVVLKRHGFEESLKRIFYFSTFSFFTVNSFFFSFLFFPPLGTEGTGCGSWVVGGAG